MVVATTTQSGHFMEEREREREKQKERETRVSSTPVYVAHVVDYMGGGL